MRIRYRISLWVTVAGLISTLLFSLFIIIENIELPYELVDHELNNHGKAVARVLENSQTWEQSQTTLAPLGSSYWMRVFDASKKVMYESDLVHFVELSINDVEVGKGYTVESEVLLNRIFPDMDPDDEDEFAAFRVLVVPIVIGDRQYLLQIARPLENIVNEVRELIQSLVLGLLLFLGVLLAVSYYVAGKILTPIRTINSMVHEISEQTMGNRIPLGDSVDELHELSVSLNNMFDRLQYSFESQKEFVANASHELKTPLAILRLSMEESLQYQGLPEDLQKGMVDHNNTLLRLSRLVENLLNLSLLELSENKKTEEFCLSSLLKDVVEQFTSLIQQKNITLQMNCEESLSFVGTEGLMRQALINLLDNAIKYNVEGGTIQIRLLDNGHEILAQLFNSGSGIPADDQDKIFDQFYRVEKSRALTHGGSGLGLTIVKRIIELHSGTIEVQSKPDKWTQFTITLPRSAVS